MKNFLRRLFRFVNDPRYGLFYSPTPEAYKKAWESVVGDSLKQPFSLRTDPMPGDRPSFKTAFRELRPPLEWPDFLGNGLFVLFCMWVLTARHFVAGGLLDCLADLARYSDGPGRGCLLKSAGWLGAPGFRTTTGAKRLRRGCGAARRVKV